MNERVRISLNLDQAVALSEVLARAPGRTLEHRKVIVLMMAGLMRELLRVGEEMLQEAESDPAIEKELADPSARAELASELAEARDCIELGKRVFGPRH